MKLSNKILLIITMLLATGCEKATKKQEPVKPAVIENKQVPIKEVKKPSVKKQASGTIIKGGKVVEATKVYDDADYEKAKKKKEIEEDKKEQARQIKKQEFAISNQQFEQEQARKKQEDDAWNKHVEDSSNADKQKMKEEEDKVYKIDKTGGITPYGTRSGRR